MLITKDILDSDDLTPAITVPQNHLDLFIKEVHTQVEGSINFGFYILRCTREQIRTRDFIKGIKKLIVPYALDKKEYPSPIEPTDVPDVWQKARSRFVTSPTSGEPGELILFAFLEDKKNAPQLINKMGLKTSGEVHYHGLDGIHIGVDGDDICLYYGESKVYQNLPAAIKKAIVQLNDFHNTPSDEDSELDIISNHIDFNKFGDSVKKVLEVLNPYSKDKTALKKIYVVFIGHEWSPLQDCRKLLEKGDLEQAIVDNYIKQTPLIIKECCTECEGTTIENEIEFYFIPFPSVKDFREEFLEVLK